jgi:HK97 gp10 family phage protein
MASQRFGDTRVRVEFDNAELAQLRAEFARLPKNISARYLAAALRAAAKPALTKLRQLTPKGPTGNLKRAIATKVKRYRSGNAVALVGYQAARGGGRKTRGFHQGFLEFGTKLRRAKGQFASTYWSKTPDRAGKFQITSGRRGASAGKIRTKPFPKSFFKAAKRGQRVELGKMPVGGRKRLAPVKTAWVRSQSEVRATLALQMGIRLENALKDIRDGVKRRGVRRVSA